MTEHLKSFSISFDVMVNIYDFIVDNSTYFDQMTFGKNDGIFIDYLCPITAQQANVWSHKNCLMYVVQGAKGYASGDHYHESKEHQVLFIRKGGYMLHQRFEKPYQALIFMFDDEAVINFLAEYPDLLRTAITGEEEFMNLPAVFELETSPFIKSIFISSLAYLSQPTDESRISIDLKFRELLANLIRSKDANPFYFYLFKLCNHHNASFMKLMHENSHLNFTTKELARMAGMSLSTFKRAFKKQLGLPPGKWLHQQRISRAKKLLAGTDKTITEIAFELGYSDAAAFSKAFKQSTKLNPSDFVKNQEAGPK